MQEILTFLNDCGVYYLATVDGEQPRVRPLGFVMEWQGKLAFCTGNNKAMCRQMAANPRVEISCVGADMRTLRLTGRVAFEPARAAKEQALRVMPDLGKLYAPDDGVFEIFTLEPGSTATFQSMAGETRTLTL